MNAVIECRPGSAAAKLTVSASEHVTAEAGAMIAMSADMTVETTTYKKGQGKARVGKALRRMFAGESFFLNHFTAGPDGGELCVATTMPGDMEAIGLTGAKLVVQAGSFVACDGGIDLDVGWQGFKSLFSGESLFWLQLSGVGTVVVNSFGAMYRVDVTDEYIVDTGHIVAFDDGLSFTVVKAAKSWASSVLGGEGLVCRFSGTGRVYCQSHNAHGFGRSLSPFLAPKKN